MRNATAFRGEADKTASPCCSYAENVPPKRASGTFGTYFSFITIEKQWLTPLLGIFSLAENPSFEATASKFTF